MGTTVRDGGELDGWVVTTHTNGKRSQRGFGRGSDSETRAREFAAALELEVEAGERWLDGSGLRTDEAVRGWFVHYRAGLARSTEATNFSVIENHIAPWFGSTPLSAIGEPELLAFVENIFERGLSKWTAANALSILRRVCTIHHDAGLLKRNPVANLGRIVSKVGGRYATEVDELQAWTTDEAAELLELARQHEPHVAPVLLAAFHTGMRRGELLGLEWRDVRGRVIAVRRSLVADRMKTPKSGKSREVPISPDLRELLAGLRGEVRTRRAFRDAGPVFLSPRA
jgi:integrase